MHSVCSSTLSLSCKGFLSSYSFNDYSCVLNDRFDKPLFPLSSSSSFSSSCCACCSNSIYRIPINPSILYGLRQSTLIQWSPSRTLILGGLDRRRRSKIPVCNIDQSCYYEKSYSIRKGRNGCLGSEGRKKHQQSCDAEVMLSLLMEEEVGGRERNERSFRKVKLEKGRKSFGGSDNVSKKIIDSGVSGGKSEYESIENEPKEKRGQEEEEKEEENSWREENHKVRARKDGSSSSSYYSVDSHSSSAEFEGDSEIQLKGEKSKTGEFERNVGYYGENQEHRVVSKKKNNEIYDMRKKSEKKLDEVTIAEASSVKNSSKTDANEKKYSRTVDSDAELKKYKQFKEISDIQQSNIEEISRSRMKTKEEESTVIENSNILKDKEAKHEERIHKQLVSRRKSQQSTETSISQDVDLQKMSVSDRKSDTMIQKQEERDSKERINKQTGLRRKSQQSTETSISHDVEMSVSDMKSGAMIQKQEERDSNVVFSSNSQRVHEEIPSNQTRYRQKKHNHSVDERLLEIEERKEEDHEPSTVSSSHEDAIGSADRLHKSSMKYVGEFLEKARQEISTIDEIRKDEKNREEKGPADEMWDVADRESIDTGVVVATAGTTTAGDDESSGGVKRSGRSLWNIMGDIVRLRWISRSENRSSSSKLGGKPSPNQSTGSETWFSGHEQFEKNDEGLRKEKTIIGKQPPPSVSSEGEGRSLSSRGRSSPPGEEAFEKNYENTLSGTVVAESSSSRGRSSPSRAETSGRNYENTLSGTVVKESSSSSGRASPSVAEAFRKNYENTLSGSVVVEPSSSRGRSSPSGAETFVKNYENTLSGTVVAESSSSKGRSSPSSTEPFEKNYDTTLSGTAIAESSSSKGRSLPSSTEPFEKNYDTTLSGTVIAESSSPLPAIRMRRSPVAEETTGMFKTETSSGGLTRTKLQRKNQFPKDRYDEWEEAYKLETEQRKIDEMFMREALVEAKKAADNWEVPVGAVLVQHGKIIARGCNLVEELRDSTAHAEMICIREASNVLRTWRLSETTLYVTLEPCPMCAGAILQARVDTVVWGAPNKLLGADGSWIRLFPDGGEEGGEGSEETDKVPPAPKHPFHPKITVRRGVLASECADIMQQFFQLRRRKKETKSEPLPTPPSCLPISHHPSKFFTKMHDAFHIMFCL